MKFIKITSLLIVACVSSIHANNNQKLTLGSKKTNKIFYGIGRQVAKENMVQLTKALIDIGTQKTDNFDKTYRDLERACGRETARRIDKEIKKRGTESNFSELFQSGQEQGLLGFIAIRQELSSVLTKPLSKLIIERACLPIDEPMIIFTNRNK